MFTTVIDFQFPPFTIAVKALAEIFDRGRQRIFIFLLDAVFFCQCCQCNSANPCFYASSFYWIASMGIPYEG
jgi:hypothetical protein